MDSGARRTEPECEVLEVIPLDSTLRLLAGGPPISEMTSRALLTRDGWGVGDAENASESGSALALPFPPPAYALALAGVSGGGMRRYSCDREGVTSEVLAEDVGVATPLSGPFCFLREVLGEGVAGAFRACRRSVRALRVTREGPAAFDSCTKSCCALYYKEC